MAGLQVPSFTPLYPEPPVGADKDLAILPAEKYHDSAPFARIRLLAPGSISMLLAQFQGGDEAALGGLHARCWPALVELARAKLRGAPVRMAGEEDVAQEALVGFVRSVRGGRVAPLASRHEFFALLTHITACKAAGLMQRELGTKKRGGGKVASEGIFAAGASGEEGPGLAGFAGPGLPPDEEAALRDAYAYFFGALDEPLREIAELHLAGLTNLEAAGRLGCSERTIERKLNLIRDRWQELAREMTEPASRTDG